MAMIQLLVSQLGELELDISFHDSPHEWLQANIDKVQRIAIDLLPEVSRDDLPIAGLVNLIYPRSFLYTYAHAKFHQLNVDDVILNTIEAKLADWVQLDEITQLAYNWTIFNHLRDFLSDASIYNDIPRKIIKLDLMCLVARILIIIHDKQRRKFFTSQKGAHAQQLLDFLQAILDSQDFDIVRSPILRVALELAKKSCLYPTCLFLEGVTRRGMHATYGGGFGDIWEGDVGGSPVAIKIMRIFDPSEISKAVKAFAKEAVLWRQLRHPNVLPFYGVHQCVEESPRICLVSPWMTNGNIVQYLRSTPDVYRLSLIADVTHGLKYLHTFDPPVVHGDLRGVNILVTPALRACLADFGLCTFVQDSGLQFTPTSSAYQFNALRWRPPELFDYQSTSSEPRISLAADIYAFGCVCYEIFVGAPCFAEFPDFQVIQAVVKGERPARPNMTVIDDAVWSLMQWCWQQDPKARPTTDDILQRLLALPDLSGYTDPTADWDEAVMNNLDALPLVDIPTLRSAQPEETNLGDPSSPEPAIASPSSLHSLEMEGTGSICSNSESRSSCELPTVLITESDLVIALMGPTGTGKSTFINTAAGKVLATSDDGLGSCTRDVRAFSVPHPNRGGRNVIFVDTPGFDDSDRTDYDVLNDIANWLIRTYKRRITLTGILYFHRIGEVRLRGTPLRNLLVFQGLCGEDALQNVILTTTMWNQVSSEIGVMREAQLKTDFWAAMMAHGCRLARYDSRVDSPWNLVDKFDIDDRRPIQLQEEMVDEGKKLNQTTAFSILVNWWGRAVDRLKKRTTASAQQGSVHDTDTEKLSQAEKQKRQLDTGHTEPWRAAIGAVTAILSGRKTLRHKNAQKPVKQRSAGS